MRYGRQVIWLSLIILQLFSACNRRISSSAYPQPPAIIDGDKLEEADAAVQRQEIIKDSLAQPRLVLMLKRTGCFGTCPVFEAKVFSDGRAIYDGLRHVAQIGLFEASVDSAWIQHVFERAKEINYWDFYEAYPSGGEPIPDLPTTITQLRLGETEKTIRNNFDPPKALVDFEHWLEIELQKLDWKKIKNE